MIELIKNTRNTLGLGQAEMAMVLGVSRSLLALAERGDRSLPLAAVVRLDQLLSKLRDFEVSSSVSIPEAEINVMIEKINFKISNAQKELTNLNRSIDQHDKVVYLIAQYSDESQEGMMLDALRKAQIKNYQKIVLRSKFLDLDIATLRWKRDQLLALMKSG